MIRPALPDLLSALYAPFRHARPPSWLYLESQSFSALSA